MLWWHSKDPEQAGLWKSTVTLSENFFNEVIDRPVPIDMRAIKALKQSLMALDIYTWLTYRVSYLKRPTAIPWASLALQFGSVASIDKRITGADDTQAYFTALSALKFTGLVYEVVLVLNRNGIKDKFASTGDEYSSIPNDAER